MGKKQKKKQAERAQAGKSKGREKRAERARVRKERYRALAFDPAASEEDRRFSEQLAALGCRVKVVDSDGNCMFRSIADQLYGMPERHGEVRGAVASFIEENEEHFKWFVADEEDGAEDEPFSDYVARMRRDGEWGGHPELYAASQVFKRNITVHQLDAPSLQLQADGPAPTIHLSYHGEFHYNSVRAEDDPDSGASNVRDARAARPEDGGAPAPSRAPAAVAVAEVVANALPWESEAAVRAALEKAGGDAEAAIEILAAGGAGGPEPAAGGEAADEAALRKQRRRERVGKKRLERARRRLERAQAKQGAGDVADDMARVLVI